MENWRKQHPSLTEFVGQHYHQSQLKLMIVGTAETFTTANSAEDTDEAYRDAWYRETDKAYAQLFSGRPVWFWSQHASLFQSTMHLYQRYWMRNNCEEQHFLFTMGPKALAELKVAHKPTNGEIGLSMDQVVYFDFFARPLLLTRNQQGRDVLDIEAQCNQQDIDESLKRFRQLCQIHHPDLVLFLNDQVSQYVSTTEYQNQCSVKTEHTGNIDDMYQVVAPANYQQILTVLTEIAVNKVFNGYRYG